MKYSFQLLFVIIIALLAGCQPKLTESKKEIVKKEVKEQFEKLVNAVNQNNSDEWAKSYSKDAFVSAIVSTEYYGTRAAFVDSITKYFALRDSQHLAPAEVRVTPLSTSIALMTSEENTEMVIKGEKSGSKHVFTMIWKKEKEGWKILHSHESWTDTKF